MANAYKPIDFGRRFRRLMWVWIVAAAFTALVLALDTAFGWWWLDPIAGAALGVDLVGIRLCRRRAALESERWFNG